MQLLLLQQCPPAQGALISANLGHAVAMEAMVASARSPSQIANSVDSIWH
jgi:hypothetical protein